MTPQDTLLCIFSFNMGPALSNCIASMRAMCPGFDAVLMDDASEDPVTLKIIAEETSGFLDVFVCRDSKAGKRHGNLYGNIERMCAYAISKGYRYLFMIQDDMQFVRPLNVDVCGQYEALFQGDEMLLQIDPRFTRADGGFEILEEKKAYRHNARTAYADVGILNLDRLKALNWKFLEGERVNQSALADLGYKRYLPFTPIIMHVPFPQTFRKGRKKLSLLPFNRGKYGYRFMSADEMQSMDNRPVSQVPYFRTFLRVKNMRFSRLVYTLRKDKKIFV